jgi:hypothetical protein
METGIKAKFSGPTRAPSGVFAEFLDESEQSIANSADAGAPMCCPAHYLRGGVLGSDCPEWACCPIWEGMGTPPPIPEAPGIGTPFQ